MWNKIKGDFHRNPKMITAGIVVILILAVVASFQLKKYIVNFWPDNERIEKNIDELKKVQRELQTLLNQTYILSKNRESFIKHNQDFWIAERDGDVATEPQKKIEKSARTAGLNLTNIGQIQSSKISDAAFTTSISISANAPMKEFSKFIVELYKIKPVFYWKNLSLRPDNIRTPVNVAMNGNLQFISITDDDIIKLLFVQESKKNTAPNDQKIKE